MTESNQIINRLHKLEKQNRYMKLGGLAIVLLVVTTLLTGASKKSDVAEEVRAKKIVLVDEQGKEIIVMDNFHDAARIYMCDSKEKKRFGLIVNDTTSLLSLIDSNENVRLSLLSSDDDDNGGYMTIRNKTNEDVVELGVDEYGNGVVGAYDRKGMGRQLTPGP
ncbi:MAG: hypothetical protein GY845_27220 [Planctomycetes bacterium]|nr:hypothetical protein [Planctomycetota bacterium]